MHKIPCPKTPTADNCSKVAGFKIDTKISTFLYTNNQHTEKAVRETIPEPKKQKTWETPEVANLALLGFGDVFALLFDNHYLYIMDLRTESLISRWPLPEYRKSKRGSSFLAGEASWLNGLDGHNDTGLVFATSMPDHSIHLVLWKEHG